MAQALGPYWQQDVERTIRQIDTGMNQLTGVLNDPGIRTHPDFEAFQSGPLMTQMESLGTLCSQLQMAVQQTRAVKTKAMLAGNTS